MCMTIYIASEYPLPTSLWDEANPCFYVSALSERDESVRRQFTKHWIYYAGSHEGCGCGFQYGQYTGLEEDVTALAVARDSRQRLAEFKDFPMISSRGVVALIKVGLLIAGLWMLLRPERPALNAAFHEGQMFARAAGGLLLILAAIPYRGPRDHRGQEGTTEDL